MPESGQGSYGSACGGADEAGGTSTITVPVETPLPGG